MVLQAVALTSLSIHINFLIVYRQLIKVKSRIPPFCGRSIKEPKCIKLTRLSYTGEGCEKGKQEARARSTLYVFNREKCEYEKRGYIASSRASFCWIPYCRQTVSILVTMVTVSRGARSWRALSWSGRGPSYTIDQLCFCVYYTSAEWRYPAGIQKNFNWIFSQNMY